MRMAAFSLILATVGRTKELDRLFNSLAAQTFLNFEVIVVDQNPDNRLVPHIERACSLGIVVKHVRHNPPNLAAARNAGIAVATGEWLGFPDDDCWYDPRVLEKIARRFNGAAAPSGGDRGLLRPPPGRHHLRPLRRPGRTQVHAGGHHDHHGRRWATARSGWRRRP